MKSRLAAAALVAALALALSACDGNLVIPSTSPYPSESVSSTPSTTPTSASPTATAIADDCPAWTDDPDAAVAAIAPNRFAGACVGMTFDEATANGTSVTGDEQCPWYATVISDDDLGYFVNVVKHGDDASGTIYLFMVKWFADPATAASYDLPATAEGITIGSTAGDVLAAYPGGTEVDFDDVARGARHQIVVPTDAATTYNFDITDGLVSEISWGADIAEGGPNGELCAL